MDCENAIKKLLESYNEGENKNIIIKSINLIIKENNLKNIKLIKMNNINNKFFKENKLNNKLDKGCYFCSICQENIKNREHKIKLNCNHVFHKKCFSKYMKTKKINLQCPNCNKSYKEEIVNLLNVNKY